MRNFPTAGPVNDALILEDYLGFSTAEQAFEVIMQYPDWERRCKILNPRSAEILRAAREEHLRKQYEDFIRAYYK